MDAADRAIEIRIDRIARSIKGRAKPNAMSEDEFTRALQIETEVSLRASSPDWCPTHCHDEGGQPVACDHGKPLRNDQRQQWARSLIRSRNELQGSSG